MAHITVTTNTGNGCLIGFHGLHVAHNILMTLATLIFGGAQASTLNLNRFVKLACGKGERMKDPCSALVKYVGITPDGV